MKTITQVKFVQQLIAIVAVYLLAQYPAVAQLVSNNNEDEVYKVDERAARNAYRPGEVIVKFKDTSIIKMRKNAKGKFQSSGVSKVDQLFNAIGIVEADQLMPLTGHQVSRRVMRSYTGDPVKDTNLSGLYRLRMDPTAATSVEDAVNQLKELDVVEYAEPNYLVFAMADNSAVYTAEPLYSQQWGPAAINLPQLWDMPLLENATRPIIAILDTGIDIEHPDLADNIWTNAAENSGAEGEDDDNNGFADDVHGWDFINQTAKIADYNGHGTHCAGIAAAVGNNGIGITGANPDAYIMPITVMQSDGTGDVATIIQGIDYATANGAEFLSMSFGGYTYSIAEEQALAKAYSKATLVASAGNNGVCIYYDHHQPGPGPCYPAAFTFVLGVEAATQGGMALFSNWDCDGPIYSAYGEEELYNYELRAPGVNIYSTYPKGRYKAMNGTSMACPLAAGAISRLMQCKSFEYQVINREILFGDLIHGANPQTGIMDVLAAYNIKDEDRVPTLWLVSTELNDVADGDGDFRPDAGEIIDLWPTIRNDWGNATNIKLHLEMGDELEDSTLIEFITNDVDFGKNLSSYGKAKSDNPIRFKVADNCPDNRHIKLKFTATCDNATNTIVQDFVIVVENGVEIGGIIDQDMTLYPNVHYIVTRSIAIPNGVTLTILPGTNLTFLEGCGISKRGNLIAEGSPNEMITFNFPINSYLYAPLFYLDGCYIRYVKFNCTPNTDYFGSLYHADPGTFEDCLFINNGSSYMFSGNPNFIRCNFLQNSINGFLGSHGYTEKRFFSCNLINNSFGDRTEELDFGNLFSSNVFCNYIDGQEVSLFSKSSDVNIFTTSFPCYYGTSSINIARTKVWDVNSGFGFSSFDISNMLTRPNSEAHGIVWKVVVDGYDAQDEFDLLPPLGVGRHKFEVYFNRDDMDTTVTPMLTMGIRPPYTQTGISDGGYWSIKDSVSVYTAFLNITGKLQADGLNRIYVSGAKDGEHFEIPYENTRFNVLVQAAGSMATGFAAEAGLGRVDLTWNNEHNDFDDAMGFNVYRYSEPTPHTVYNPHWDDQGYYLEYDTIMVADTIRLNHEIIDIEATYYTDYEVIPGETYYYYYKVLSTDLKEYDISNVVACTPLTAQRGDANGSMSVDVADVITEVAYMTGNDPQPFIFDAADVNEDQTINILDVVGTVNIIIDRNTPANQASLQSTATYSIEDGILYVDCPVELAGMQVILNMDADATLTPLEALTGMEQMSQQVAENARLFLAFSMNGKTIPAGKNALLRIGDGTLNDIVLSDKWGHNLMVEQETPTLVDRINADQQVRRGIYDLMGRKVANDATALPRLQHGIYIVNGKKMVVK